MIGSFSDKYFLYKVQMIGSQSVQVTYIQYGPLAHFIVKNAVVLHQQVITPNRFSFQYWCAWIL